MLVSRSRLHNYYLEDGVKLLCEKFGYENPMQVPKLVKIVVSASIKQDKNDAENVVSDLKLITGQQPVVTKAKKSIAGFKLREGDDVGAVVTLRGEVMYHFFDRLINVALPRARDFRGVSPKRFDRRGNFALGIKEHIIFPEINYDKVDKMRGMNIVVVTTAKNDEEGKALLEIFNMPFTK